MDGGDPALEYEFGVPIPGRILPMEQWSRTGIKRLPERGPVKFSEWFGREAPVVLDLGCGNGRYTLLSALARPEVDHVAVDVLPMVIRYATRRGNQRGLTNARFVVRDAQSFVRDLVGTGSVAEVHVYHPQPFHDPREWRRRLVAPRFLAEVHRALAPGGLFVMQTDEPAYWEYMTRVAPAFFAFEERVGPWDEVRSRREILARAKGFAVYRGVGVRRDVIDEDVIARLPMPRFRTSREGRELDRIEGGRGSGSRRRSADDADGHG